MIIKRRYIIYSIVFILALLVASASVSAKMYSIKLLSVAETSEGYKGSIADLYLEGQLGAGRVYIDTFPLTQLDTQISTRFANGIACDYLDRDCSHVDFYYTIRSNAPMLGGSSAGAAIAVLTATMIEGLDLDPGVAITGTINPGGLIGQVGGIKEKIEAASEEGIKKVLIPVQNGNVGRGNISVDAASYGESLGVEVVEVYNLNQALYEATGAIFQEKDSEFSVPAEYTETMKSLSKNLCDRATAYSLELSYLASEENYSDIYELSVNTTRKGQASMEKGDYYSSGSFCFDANTKFLDLRYNHENITFADVSSRLKDLKIDLDASYHALDWYDLETITDMQAYMVVRERLLGTYEFIGYTQEAMVDEDLDSAIYNLAYSEERYNTAKLWAEFFGKGSQEIEIDENDIEESCFRKIMETQERLEYVKFFLPIEMEGVTAELSQAYKDSDDGEFAMCLFKASKAKARVDVVIHAMNDVQGDIDGLIERNLNTVETVMSKQQKNGYFPIIGYSYYQYAKSLRELDPSSALLYSEYALELSNLGPYFGNNGKPFRIYDLRFVYIFGLGVLFGLSIAANYFGRKLRKHKKNSKKVTKQH